MSTSPLDSAALYKDLIDYSDLVFRYDSLPDSEKTPREKFEFEYLLLRYPLRLLAGQDIPIHFERTMVGLEIEDDLNRVFTDNGTAAEVQSLSKEIQEQIKARVTSIEQIVGRSSILQKLEWLNVSFWCLIGSRMPVLANVKNGQAADPKLSKRNFERIWAQYSQNTSHLVEVARLKSKEDRSKSRQAVESKLNTINAFICEEATRKQPLHIKFTDRSPQELANEDFDRTLLIPDSLVKNDLFMGDRLGIKSEEMYDLAQTYDQSPEAKPYFARVVKFLADHFAPPVVAGDYPAELKARIIVQNISLWRKYYCQPTQEDYGLIKDIYMFPVSLEDYIFGTLDAYYDLSRKKPVSVLAVGLNAPLLDEEEDFFKTFTGIILTKALLLNLTKVIYKKNARQREALQRSGMTAIMARNGSHNIGSHILSSVSNSITDLPDSQTLFKYVQHRMDFIAQIPTEFPNWTYPSWVISDLMRRFYMQRNVLSYIAESEGLGAYEYADKSAKQVGKLVVKLYAIQIQNGKKCRTAIVDPEKGITREEALKHDVQVAIPGGVIGNQAFYTILENIIRNSAKHGWAVLPQEEKRGKNLEITVEFEDRDEFVFFRVFDNVSDIPEAADQRRLPTDGAEKDGSPKEIDDLANVQAPEKLPLHQRTNFALMSSFIDKSAGELRRENWGLAEIKIAAGFLNLRSLSDIGAEGKGILLDVKDAQTGIIAAEAYPDGKAYRLAYTFVVPKPREVLIVDAPSEFGDRILTFRNNGIFVKGDYAGQRLDYELVVICEDATEEFGKIFDQEVPKEANPDGRKTKFEHVQEVIERFPYRLFYATASLNALNQKLEALNEDVRRFIRARVVFLDKSELHHQLANIDLNQLKLWLFGEWILHVKQATGQGSQDVRLFVDPSGHVDMKQDYILRKTFEKFQGAVLAELKAALGINDALEVIDELGRVELYEIEMNPGALLDVYTFVTYWTMVAGQKTRNSFDLTEELTEVFDRYFQMVKSLLVKYDEDIETLPRMFRAKEVNRQHVGGMIFQNSDYLDGLGITILDPDNEREQSNDTMSYNRHVRRSHGLYRERLSGSQIYYSLFDISAQNAYLQTKFLLQLVENGLLRVLIVDERVAEYQQTQGKEIKEAFEYGRITVATSARLSDQSGVVYLARNDPSFNVPVVFEGPQTTIQKGCFDMAIIHQGVLDKIIKRDDSHASPDSSSHPYDDLILSLKKRIPFVAVTSGRGLPAHLPDRVKFIAFSNLESFLLKSFHEKFLLLQTIMKITIHQKRGRNAS